MKLRDIRLGVKQTVGFGLVIAVMTGATLFVFSHVAALRAQIEATNSHRLPPLLAIFDLNRSIAELRTAQLQHSVASDAAVKRLQAEKMVGLLDTISSALSQYERLRGDDGPAGVDPTREAALYHAFGEQWEQYQDLSFEVLRHSLANEDDAAVALIGGRGGPVYDAISRDLAGLVELNRAGFLAAAQQARDAYAATRTILMAAVIATLLVSVVLGVALVGMVVRPVAALAQAADQVARGDLAVRLDRPGGDELGRLTTSFNQMTTALARARQRDEEQRAAISRANDELAEQVVRIRDLSAINLEQERALRREVERELETARQLQQDLMPKERLQVAGFDIAGRWLPAQQVGGDLFQYLALPGGRLGLGLADVSGHAMAAAIPVALFSGLLEGEGERYDNAAELLSRLNRTLHRVLQPRTFVCFSLVDLMPSERLIRLSNGGCPYPLHYRARGGQIEEVELVARPLGVSAHTRYPVREVALEPGDRVILYSDGIPEALSPEDDMFGYERTVATVLAACREGGSAEQIIDRIVTAVQAHAQRQTPHDDQTVVVLGVDAC